MVSGEAVCANSHQETLDDDMYHLTTTSTRTLAASRKQKRDKLNGQQSCLPHCKMPRSELPLRVAPGQHVVLMRLLRHANQLTASTGRLCTKMCATHRTYLPAATPQLRAETRLPHVDTSKRPPASSALDGMSRVTVHAVALRLSPVSLWKKQLDTFRSWSTPTCSQKTGEASAEPSNF